MTSMTAAERKISQRHLVASVLLLGGMAATIASALAFEHIGGYVPCALCLEQRVPYYWGIPIAAIAAIASLMVLPGAIVRLLLLAATVCLVITAGLAEWSGSQDDDRRSLTKRI